MSMLQAFRASPSRASMWAGRELGSAPRAAPTAGLNTRALRRAIAYIEANLGERFTLDALAMSAGVSRFHFARLFRVSTGHSPMGFLMRSRIEHARHMLETTDRSICEIAASLGFCDQSHFTRTFRRLTGMAPRSYSLAHGAGASRRDGLVPSPALIGEEHG